MKKIIKTSVFIALALIINSCTNNSLSDNNESLVTKVKVEDYLKTNYGIITTDLGNGNLQLVYPDGLNLDIKNLNGSYLMSGSKISNKSITLKMNEEKSDIINSVKFTSEISKTSLLNNLNLQKKRNKNNSSLKRTFGQCFKEEWNSFCSDFISCVAQVTNPHGIAAAVAIACGIEAAQEQQEAVFIEQVDLDTMNEIELIEIEIEL